MIYFWIWTNLQINAKDIDKQRMRKGPEESAKWFAVGTRQRGQDGAMWRIIATNNGRRWSRVGVSPRKSPLATRKSPKRSPRKSSKSPRRKSPVATRKSPSAMRKSPRRRMTPLHERRRNVAITGRTPRRRAQYAGRPSPSFHAGDYAGERRRGNDGSMWESKRNVRGIYQWRKV